MFSRTLTIAMWPVAGLLVSAAVLTLAMTILRVDGKRVWSVQSNSMLPDIHKGDAVIVDTKQATRAQPGQIVSYHSPFDSRVQISHRLLAMHPATGLATTQGDANTAPDSPFPKADIAGVVTAVLPGFGKLLDLVHEPLSLMALVYLPALVILGQEANRLATSLTYAAYRLHTSHKVLD